MVEKLVIGCEYEAYIKKFIIHMLKELNLPPCEDIEEGRNLIRIAVLNDENLRCNIESIIQRVAEEINCITDSDK